MFEAIDGGTRKRSPPPSASPTLEVSRTTSSSSREASLCLTRFPKNSISTRRRQLAAPTFQVKLAFERIPQKWFRLQRRHVANVRARARYSLIKKNETNSEKTVISQKNRSHVLHLSFFLYVQIPLISHVVFIFKKKQKKVEAFRLARSTSL